jgi:hypothetical protein
MWYWHLMTMQRQDGWCLQSHANIAHAAAAAAATAYLLAEQNSRAVIAAAAARPSYIYTTCSCIYVYPKPKAYLLAEAKQSVCITQLHCFCLQVLGAQPAAASVKHGQTRSTDDVPASARGAEHG